MNPKETVYLGMGTNLGDRLQQIKQAVHLLRRINGVKVTKLSSIYETEPVGYLEQPHFLNLVCEIQTTLTPTHLFAQIQMIEQRLKRVRTVRWGPRTIDIDILLFGSRIIHQPDLVVPHPRMLQRSFVMVPLAELVHDLIIPGTARTVAQWRKMLSDQAITLVHEPIQVENFRKEDFDASNW